MYKSVKIVKFTSTGSTISLTTQRILNRDSIGSVRSTWTTHNTVNKSFDCDNLTFSAKVSEGSYRPPIGLEAAIIEQRACDDR